MSLEPILWDVARSVRSFLEPVWPEWHRARNLAPDVASRGTCGRSSLFLQQVLERECAIEAQWATGVPEIAGDNEPTNVGFFAHNRWHAHSWVEVENRWIVDITADQFSAPPIIITTIPDARFRKGIVDTASPEFRNARFAAADALWPRWEHSADRTRLRPLI